MPKNYDSEAIQLQAKFDEQHAALLRKQREQAA